VLADALIGNTTLIWSASLAASTSAVVSFVACRSVASTATRSVSSFSRYGSPGSGAMQRRRTLSTEGLPSANGLPPSEKMMAATLAFFKITGLRLGEGDLAGGLVFDVLYLISIFFLLLRGLPLLGDLPTVFAVPMHDAKLCCFFSPAEKLAPSVSQQDRRRWIDARVA
jgi:hypothetical protein